MMPAAPASRTRRMPSTSETPPATIRSASTVRASVAISATSASPVACPARTGGRPARRARRAGRAARAARRGAIERRRAGPVGRRGPRQASRRPRPGMPRRSAGSSATARVVTTRVAPAANAMRIAVRRIDAAGELERRRHPRRDRAERLGVRRRPGPGAVEVDDVDERGAEGHEVLGDPLRPIRGGARAGRHAGPEHDARAALLEVDRRDDLHALGRGRRVADRRHALAAKRSPVEADRQGATVEQRVVEGTKRERGPETALLLAAQPQQQHLAQQVRQVVRRRVRVAPRLRERVRRARTPCARSGSRSPPRSTSRRGASGRPGRSSRPARSRRSRRRDAERRAVVEALLAHHLLAVHAPALLEFRRRHLRPGQRRMARRESQLEVVAGIRLVDAGVADRRAIVLAHRAGVAVDVGRDDVDAHRRRVPARGLEVGRERQHAAQVRRCRRSPPRARPAGPSRCRGRSGSCAPGTSPPGSRRGHPRSWRSGRP